VTASASVASGSVLSSSIPVRTARRLWRAWGTLGLDTRGNPAFTGSQLLLNSRGLCDTTKLLTSAYLRREERLNDEELADQITEMAIEWFWPAIYRGDLEVAVEVEGETKQASIDEYPQYKPFTSCLDDRDDSVSQLDEPGNVAQKTISLNVPKKE